MPTSISLMRLAGISLFCLASVSAHADVIKCNAPDGSVTYTDTRCSGTLIVADLPPDNRYLIAQPIKHGSQWAEKIAPRQVRTDVESVRSAYDALKRRDGAMPVAETASR
ncbi:DUF4124 domain-containing protein [uncultured Oxalicibacterium sp.]|uniref:DUF4124 domain-containing protein n=1 Tax=uncultured Oxalicibacterium sp. TaxID=1168540 RepID=UPI0025E3C859|nr:DUF4124 domain-containing protein [uncultured Oxalicibacterium sp.]